MNVIDATALLKSYGSRTILDGVTFTIAEGEKVGIIGRNGCGKSTLLRILGGLEDRDGGELIRQRGLSAAYLAQEPDLDPALTIQETLDASLSDARQRTRRYQEIAEALQSSSKAETERLVDEQQQIQGWLDHHQAWNLDHQVAEICSRFGIADTRQKIGKLSGGWVKRVALAGILLRQPDLLLLDEPTNHLDADTVAWLEEILKNYPGAVMLVTHDRYFLDRVVNRMFELEEGLLIQYQGGYSAYLEQKQANLVAEGRSQSRLMNLLRREEAWLHRGAKARTTKQKARIDRVGDLRDQKKTVGTREVRLSFDPQQRLGGTILELKRLGVDLADRNLFRDVDLILRKGERVGILGPNGCGKSTLLKTVLGELAPSSGTVILGKNSRIGYLDQGRSGLDPEQLVHEAVGQGDWVALPGGDKRHKVGYLEDFLFSRDEQRKRISTLSGGERARLLLAKLMLEGANLLILDEPTNDLDIPTMQVLEEAFAEFPGCILVVTHDRYFLDRVATGILHFEGEGKAIFQEGNYDDLCRAKEAQLQAARVEGKKAASAKAEAKDDSGRRKSGLSYKERQELTAVEEKIAALENRKVELEALLADPATLAGHEHLQEITRELSLLEGELAIHFKRWEELELKKEEA
jgi:ATP-binding cassette subfamily F protein uup